MTDVETRTVRRYLLDNAAGHVNDEISNQILQSLKPNSIPVRITQIPFFVDKHNHVNNKIKQINMGKCDYCHQNAQQGLYKNIDITN